MKLHVRMGDGVSKSCNRSVHKTTGERGDIGERRQSSPDVNSTKNCHVAKADTTRKSRYTVHEDSMRHPPQRTQNWATRPSRRINQKFEGTAAAGKAWLPIIARVQKRDWVWVKPDWVPWAAPGQKVSKRWAAGAVAVRPEQRLSRSWAGWLIPESGSKNGQPNWVPRRGQDSVQDTKTSCQTKWDRILILVAKKS